MSIASEITRLQSAKSALKTAINAKTDAQHQIGNETISDYASFVDTIQTGGSSAGEFKVKTVDYDGTVIDEKWLDTGDVYTLPTAPTHTKLTFAGWSCNVTITNNTVTVGTQDIYIGAIYNTTSGNNEYDILLTSTSGLTVTLGFTATNIDWGDGTTEASSSTHTYADYGSYTISFNDMPSTYKFFFNQRSSNVNKYLTEVRLSSTPTFITDNAFDYCQALEKVSLGSNITKIGYQTFHYCYALKSIILPPNCNNLSGYAFQYCRALSIIVFPKALTSITGQNAIAWCNALSEVSFSDVLTDARGFVGGNALYRIQLPSTLTVLPSALNYVRELVIPSGVTTAVMNWVATEKITFKGNLVASGGNAYYTKEVIIDGSPTAFPTSFLQGFTALNNLDIPSTITTLGTYCFRECNSLSKLKMPPSLTTINGSAFSNCTALTEIDFSDCQQVPSLGNDAFYGMLPTCRIIVPDSLYSTWISTTGWDSAAVVYVKASEA